MEMRAGVMTTAGGGRWWCGSFLGDPPTRPDPGGSQRALTTAVAFLGRSHSSVPRSLRVSPAPSPSRPRLRDPHVAQGPILDITWPQRRLHQPIGASGAAPLVYVAQSEAARVSSSAHVAARGWVLIVAPPPRSHPDLPSSGPRNSPGTPISHSRAQLRLVAP